VPTAGRRDSLRRTLSHLSAQTVPAADIEVIVVGPDGPAGERIAAALTAAPTGTRHLSCDQAGPTAKRNLGWRAARAPLVLFVDDDVLADPELVAEHLAAHESEPDPAIGVLGGLRWARELRITPFMRWLEQGVMFDFAALDEAAAGGVTDAGWGRFYTANSSVKRALLEAVGGFDEQTFTLYYEDLDLALRAHRALGFRLRYRPSAAAEHLSAPTLEDWRVRVAALATAERRFVARHPEIPPYYHDRFAAAAAAPRARGRGARLAAVIPRRTPGLGARVWASAEARFLQDLAPPFLKAWHEGAEQGDRESTDPLR
jgi:glycosyltransferase involved in cell wall biosynthesis